MIDQVQYDRLARFLPVQLPAGSTQQREFMQAATLYRIPAGKDIFVEGDRADAIALLLSGIVRVYQIGETGREITLYRFGSGQSCILTASAILSQKLFPAIAAVEQDAEALLIPAETFRSWVGRYDLWRDFVFDLLSQRLVGIMVLVEEVAFQRMDTRVANVLVERAVSGHSIRITHQEIAAELGSSREVISRILENFASQKQIRLSRGLIDILDIDAVRAYAAM